MGLDVWTEFFHETLPCGISVLTTLKGRKGSWVRIAGICRGGFGGKEEEGWGRLRDGGSV